MLKWNQTKWKISEADFEFQKIIEKIQRFKHLQANKSYFCLFAKIKFHQRMKNSELRTLIFIIIQKISHDQNWHRYTHKKSCSFMYAFNKDLIYYSLNLSNWISPYIRTAVISFSLVLDTFAHLFIIFLHFTSRRLPTLFSCKAPMIKESERATGN